jgi:hypothetical protein
MMVNVPVVSPIPYCERKTFQLMVPVLTASFGNTDEISTNSPSPAPPPDEAPPLLALPPRPPQRPKDPVSVPPKVSLLEMAESAVTAALAGAELPPPPHAPSKALAIQTADNAVLLENKTMEFLSIDIRCAAFLAVPKVFLVRKSLSIPRMGDPQPFDSNTRQCRGAMQIKLDSNVPVLKN